MKILAPLLFLFTSSVFAEQCPVPPNPCPPKKPVTKASAAPKPAPAPTQKQEQDQDSTSESTATATTGNQSQSVNINIGDPEYVYGKRKTYRLIKSSEPNRLQFLLGLSNTYTKTDVYDCYVRTRKDHELDGGIQYLRDFGSLTGSAIVTLRQNVYLGFGFNW